MNTCGATWTSAKRCKPGAPLDKTRAWRTVHTCGLVRYHPGRCRCACGAKQRRGAERAA